MTLLKKIPVLMNLSPLGGKIKTGVYRVVEELVKGLAGDPRIDLTIHSTQQTALSHHYFGEHLSGYQAELFTGKFTAPREMLSARLHQTLVSSLPKRSIAYRAMRKGIVLTEKLIDTFSSHFPSEILDRTQIYHSPFHPIPSRVRKRKNIIRFTTVYDLIAITNPEYFGVHTAKGIRKLIGSFDETDHAFCISEATRKTLLELSRITPENAHVVHLAAASHFYPANNPQTNETVLQRHGIDAPGYILSLCTLEIRKNLQIVVNAFARLHQDKKIPPGTKLVLAGGGGWKTELFETALQGAAEVRDLIVMPGFVPDEDLAAIYSSARVFVYMSFAEGFGLPPLEAMQCGTPVITSNTSSLPEVVGHAGITLDPNDLDGLCNSILHVYEDDEHHQKLCQKSLERSAHFSWRKYIDQTVECYQKALASTVTDPNR